MTMHGALEVFQGDHQGRRIRRAAGYFLALAFVTTAGVVATALEGQFDLRDPSLVFLLGVLLAALVAGLGPSLLASAASVLAYDYFFTEPYHTLSIRDPQDVLSVLVFLVTAALTSHLVARVRSQAAEAEARESRMAALFAFTRELAAAARAEDLPAIVTRHIGERFHAGAVVLLPGQAQLAPLAAHPADMDFPSSEREAASFAWAEGRSALLALQNAAGRCWVHISLGTIRGEVAVLSLRFPAAVQLASGDEQLLEAFTQQAGVALERWVVDRGARTTPPLPGVREGEGGTTWEPNSSPLS